MFLHILLAATTAANCAAVPVCRLNNAFDDAFDDAFGDVASFGDTATLPINKLPETIAPPHDTHEYACDGNACDNIRNVQCTRHDLKWRCNIAYSGGVDFIQKPSVTCENGARGVRCRVHVRTDLFKLSIVQSFIVVISVFVMLCMFGPLSLLVFLIRGNDHHTSSWDDC